MAIHESITQKFSVESDEVNSNSFGFIDRNHQQVEPFKFTDQKAEIEEDDDSKPAVVPNFQWGGFSVVRFDIARKMHPPLTLHRHPMCAEIIEQFQKCHTEHPVAKFFGECTNLKIQLDRCFRQEKALKRKANFEESKKLRERLQAYRKETALEEST